MIGTIGWRLGEEDLLGDLRQKQQRAERERDEAGGDRPADHDRDRRIVDERSETGPRRDQDRNDHDQRAEHQSADGRLIHRPASLSE
jgi:hypothetical protein